MSFAVASVTRRPLGTLGRVVSCPVGEAAEQGAVEARINPLGERFPAASRAATHRRYDLPQASPRTVKFVPRIAVDLPLGAMLSLDGKKSGRIVAVESEVSTEKVELEM